MCKCNQSNRHEWADKISWKERKQGWIREERIMRHRMQWQRLKAIAKCLLSTKNSTWELYATPFIVRLYHPRLTCQMSGVAAMLRMITPTAVKTDIIHYLTTKMSVQGHIKVVMTLHHLAWQGLSQWKLPNHNSSCVWKKYIQTSWSFRSVAKTHGNHLQIHPEIVVLTSLNDSSVWAIDWLFMVNKIFKGSVLELGFSPH